MSSLNALQTTILEEKCHWSQLALYSCSPSDLHFPNFIHENSFCVRSPFMWFHWNCESPTKDVFWLLLWGKFVFTVRDPITLWPGPHPKPLAIPCLERTQDTPQRAGLMWTEAIKTYHQPCWRLKRAEAEWERTYTGDSRGRNWSTERKETCDKNKRNLRRFGVPQFIFLTTTAVVIDFVSNIWGWLSSKKPVASVSVKNFSLMCNASVSGVLRMKHDPWHIHDA